MEINSSFLSTDDAQRYRALTARDARYDGVFFTGVKTTGIYCRPVCTAKTPRASSCTFFDSAAAAESAGFRPCLRCRPELAPYDVQANLAYAIWQRIAAGALNDGDLERLSDEVGLSSRQLRRVLLQHFGVTPVELAQTQRLLFAKKLLQETRLPITELAFAAGFGSVRRFNTLFTARYGLAPGELRRAAPGRSALTRPSASASRTASSTDTASTKRSALARSTAAASEAAHDVLTLRLAYRPPFGWPETIAYMGARAIAGVEAVDRTPGAEAYMRSIRLGDAHGWLRVTHVPSHCQLELALAPSLTPVLMPLIARIRNQFDLDANPQVIHAQLAQDPLLAATVAARPGTRVPGAFDAFELAVRAVLGQQVSVAGATTLSGRLVTRFGTPLVTPFAAVTHAFPRAEVLADADHLEIAAIGLPKKRALTIRNLAQFSVGGGMDMKPGATLEDTVRHLRSVPGIGEWTAQYIALRALRFPDAFPGGDLALQKAAARDVDGVERLTEKQLMQRAAGWSPWRGYAALLLWHSLG